MLSISVQSQLKDHPTHLQTRVSAGVRGVLFVMLVLAALYPASVQPGSAADPLSGNFFSSHAAHDSYRYSRQANFSGTPSSADVRAVADWVARVDDSGGMAFVIIDKKAAHLYVFNAEAQLLGSSAVLLGSALGDETVPGIGDRPIEMVKPDERTTPAGRFIGERGRNARGEDVVWVDYDAAVSMHRVITSNPVERRLERLASPTPDDNRISYGCINVPLEFYETHLRPAFSMRRAMVYVLPDSGPLQQFFGM